MTFKVGDRVRFKRETFIRNIDVQSMDWTAQPNEEFIVTKANGSRLVISPVDDAQLCGTFIGDDDDGQSVLELIEKGNK